MTGAPGRLVSLGRLMRMDVHLDHAVSLGESSDNDICLVGNGIASHHARIVPVNGHWQVEAVDARAAAASCVNGRPITQPTILSHLDVVTLGQDVELVFLSPPTAPATAPPAAQSAAPAPAPPPPAPKAAPPAPPPPPPAPKAAPPAPAPAPPPPAPKPVAATKPADATEYRSSTARPVPPPLAGKAPAASPAPAAKTSPAFRVARVAGAAGTFTLKAGVNTIGRSPESDICLNNRQISRDHAMILVTPGAITIEHRSGSNRTTVNGEVIAGPRILRAGDRLGFVDIEFELQLE